MINLDNDRKLQKLVLSLNHRLSPAVYFISCNTEKLRKQLYEIITKEAPRFKHIEVDLTLQSVYSLRDAITRFVPEEVIASERLDYVVHFTGISSSLFTSENGELQRTMLLEELNFEREVLFQDYPFISVLWTNPYFFKELFWKAGDLMSWVFDRYEFADESPEGVAHEIPYTEPLQKPGAVAERTERIKELEDLVERLNEEDENQQKVMLQKMNVYLLLGKECLKAFRWKDAEVNLLKAKALSDKISTGSFQQLEIFFSLGNYYLEIHKYDAAIEFFEQTLKIAHKIDESILGSIYHQIGYVYQQQCLWKEALAKYTKAIEWNDKTDNNYYLGNTYHHIGMLYQRQNHWEEALAYYYKAIEWDNKTGNKSGLANTYQQIGFTYQQQRHWKEALSNYNKAITLNAETENNFYVGNIYHQIGTIYEQQQLWQKAIANYLKAIEWKEKTGNVYELGGTYHELGKVYEEMGQSEIAGKYFFMAIENLKKFNHPHLPVAEESLKWFTQAQKTVSTDN